MEVAEITELLDGWVDEALTGLVPGVPAPPDARRSWRRISRFRLGHLEPGEDQPRDGLMHEHLEFGLHFRPHEEPEIVADTAPRLRAALAEDPSLGGRFDAGRVHFDEGDVKVEQRDGKYGLGTQVVELALWVEH